MSWNSNRFTVKQCLCFYEFRVIRMPVYGSSTRLQQEGT